MGKQASVGGATFVLGLVCLAMSSVAWGSTPKVISRSIDGYVLTNLPVPPLMEGNYPSPKLTDEYMNRMRDYAESNEKTFEHFQGIVNGFGSTQVDIVCSFKERTIQIIGGESSRMGIRKRAKLMIGALTDILGEDTGRFRIGVTEVVAVPNDKKERCLLRAKPFRIRLVNGILDEI